MTNTCESLARYAIPAVLLACIATACSASPSSAPPASGGSTPTTPVVLRIGTDDGDQAPGAAQITRFAQGVSTRSHGTIRVEPVWHADGHGVPHWDQAVVQMLFDSKLDLAMVPSRAWDDLGVASLRALTAPFLITTDTLASKVGADPALAEQLTSGLSARGVTALGLYPEGLRHPFGFSKPLLGADDYRGGVIRAPWSRTANAMFEVLGARCPHPRPGPGQHPDGRS